VDAALYLPERLPIYPLREFECKAYDDLRSYQGRDLSGFTSTPSANGSGRMREAALKTEMKTEDGVIRAYRLKPKKTASRPISA